LTFKQEKFTGPFPVHELTKCLHIMVSVKKIGESRYMVSFQKNTPVIDQHTGYLLKKETGLIISANRIIHIDLKTVDEADKNGVKMLRQLIDLADKKHCKLEFINTKPALDRQLQILK
jgi:anti-anti-sigma regulatory factor